MYFDEYKSKVNRWPTINGRYVITRNIESNSDCFTYNYCVTRDFSSPKEIIEAAEFADENFQGNWLIGIDTSGFEMEEDAMVFKLRFF